MNATVMPLADLAPPADANPVVDIEGLWTVFGRGESEVVIHRDLALQVRRGEVLTLVADNPEDVPPVLAALAQKLVAIERYLQEAPAAGPAGPVED